MKLWQWQLERKQATHYERTRHRMWLLTWDDEAQRWRAEPKRR